MSFKVNFKSQHQCSYFWNVCIIFLDCPFLIAPSIFSNVFFTRIDITIFILECKLQQCFNKLYYICQLFVSYFISVFNQCSTNPCRNGGVCKNEPDSFTCDCSATSFSGNTCSDGRSFINTYKFVIIFFNDKGAAQFKQP